MELQPDFSGDPWKPKLANELFYTSKDSKHLFLEPSTPDWLVVNENGAYVLGLCDGRQSVSEIERRISELGGDVSIVRELLDHALLHRVLDPEHTSDVTASCGSAYSTSLAPLRNIYIQMTNACNLSCTYCYASSGVSKGTLSPDELLQFAADMRKFAPGASYILTGGEPLMNPFCLEFADHLKSHDNKVFLTTNGTPITSRNVDRVVSLFDRIRISIDGIDEETHAVTRGRGNFKRVTEAINLLTDRGANLELAVVVTRKNKHQVAELASRYGEKLRYQPIMRAGRQLEDREGQLELSAEEYYNTIKDVSAGQIGARFEGLRGRGSKRCSAAEGGISVAENGDVFPCQIFHYPEYKGGNIRTDTMWDIMQSAPFRRLRNLTVDNLRECKRCAIRNICAGSCRAYAFGETGQDDVPGVTCSFHKLAIINGIFDSVAMS